MQPVAFLLISSTALVAMSQLGIGAGRASLPRPTFVTSEACRGCHVHEYESWLTTSHAYALRDSTSATVLGRFDGQVIETPYFRAIPQTKSDQYVVKIEAKDSRPSAEHVVSYVIGKTSGQSLLFTGPQGEWRVLPIFWNIERGQWDLSRRAMAEINGDLSSFPENFDSREKIFNDGCGQCHVTQYDIGYDDRTHSYHSRFLEGSVACESCHGPGSAHVEWHKSQKTNRPEYRAPARLLHPAEDLDARGILLSCGRCHYKHDWRYAIDEDPRVPFTEIAISRNYDGLGFFADGRVSGLNYHGTTQSQSACFRGGMSCLSCHQMHGGRPRALKREATSDAQCSGCHAKVAVDARRHSHHTNIRCVDCHMPKLTSGVLYFMRDHSLGSPEPELTERYGTENTPNACTVCHQKESARWAREWKERWWRPAPQALVQDVGIVVDIRKGVRLDSAKLSRVAEDSSNRLFFRLTAIHQLSGRDDEVARASLVHVLSDSNEEVRQLATSGIAENPYPEAASPLAELLNDPGRVVRVEAAYGLARCGWRGTSNAMESAYVDAMKMLERQRSFDDILERLIVLADALGHSKEMIDHLTLLSGRQTAIRTSGDLLDRYARMLLEEGQAQKAFDFCRQSEAHYSRNPVPVEPMLRQRLLLDFADALAALGQRQRALKYWEELSTTAPPDSLVALIAETRKLALASPADGKKRELEKAIRRSQVDPAAGELRRRALWTLNVLKNVETPR